MIVNNLKLKLIIKSDRKRNNNYFTIQHPHFDAININKKTAQKVIVTTANEEHQMKLNSQKNIYLTSYFQRLTSKD